MYLLQSGVQVTADVNSLPLSTIALILGGILIALFVCLFFAAKYLSKAGPFEFKKHQIMRAASDTLTGKLFAEESTFRSKVRITTNDKEIKLENIFVKHKMCPGVLVGIVKSVPWPLFESAIDNHFTTELLPENIEGYVDRLVDSICAQYVHVIHSISHVKCMMQETLVEWDKIRPDIEDFAWDWVITVKAEVLKYCQKSKAVCQEYEEQFRGDSYYTGKTLAKIAEFDKSLTELGKAGRRSAK